MFHSVDWSKVFSQDTPVLEIIVRGSIMYLGLFLLLRVVLKRQAGTVGITDMLLVVLIADAAQNGMADDYKTVSDGLLLVAVLVFWNYVLDWVSYHFPAVEKLIHPPPLPLIRNGDILTHNLRRELITRSELLSQLREQGITDVRKVKKAFMEKDGRISVIPENGSEEKPKAENRPRIF